MSVRDLDLVKVWSDGVLIRKNIDFLRNPTKRVTFPISVQIKNIIEDLIDTYRAIPCAGIAANQLGFDKKIFIGMKDDKERMIKEAPSQNIEDPNGGSRQPSQRMQRPTSNVSSEGADANPHPVCVFQYCEI